MACGKFVEMESDSQEDTDYDTYVKRKFFPSDFVGETQSRSKRAKCFSKNALNARENRLKKKMYVENLERNVSKLTHDNRRLWSKVESLTGRIRELSKEVRYVRGVLANSADISKILQSVRHNTGMLCGTSSDKSFSFTGNYVSNKEPDIFTHFPESLLESNDDNLGLLFDDPELNLLAAEERSTTTNSSVFNALDEHNYTTHSGDSEDVGVCLHVSKHRVSLEFCHECSDNATNFWRSTENEEKP